MSSLVVRFDDLSLQGFSWVVTETENDDKPVRWQADSGRSLAELAKNHHQLTLVIPQQYVYLTHYDLPDRVSRQVLGAIEYQIEDQLAQDVEHQHVALGDLSANPVAIAVVEKSIMQRCVELLQKQGLSATQIIPEMFLCPWFGNAGDVCLLECADGVILRYGDHAAIKCAWELTETMLDHLAAEQDIQIVNYYLLDAASYPSVKVDKYPGQQNELTLNSLKLNQTGVINLMQRQFQMSSIWSKLLGIWKWVLGLLLVLLALTAYNRAIALSGLEAQLSELKAAQYHLLKDYLPTGIDQSSDLKNALISLLKQNQSGENEVNFLQLLQEFTRAESAFASVTITRIGYQNKRLSIDVTSNQLSEVEALLQALESAGQTAKLDKLSIKPNLISGQFVLEEG